VHQTAGFSATRILATFLNIILSIGGEPQAAKGLWPCADAKDLEIMVKNSPALHVLVVDDEALIRWALVETLADAGHEAVDAADARTALQALLTAPKPFDVVLLDMRLPDLSGLMVLSAFRRWSPKTQVVLMTAYGTSDMIEDALDLGAYRVIAKPLEMNDVNDLVLQAHAARF
jgi:DNA-binding NtrC family response regulator